MKNSKKNQREKRRLACEIAMYRAGFNNAAQLARAFNRYCKERGIDEQIDSSLMAHYLGCRANFSVSRLSILCRVLNVSQEEALRLDDIYTAPRNRFLGEDWVSERERIRIKDLDDNKT